MDALTKHKSKWKPTLLGDIRRFVMAPDASAAITAYFSVIFFLFFFAGSDILRDVMYLGSPFLAYYLYRERKNIHATRLALCVAGGLVAYFLINYVSILWSEPVNPEKLFQRLKMIVLFPLLLLPFAWECGKKQDVWYSCLAAFCISAAASAVFLIVSNGSDILGNHRLHGWGRAQNPVQAGLLYGIAFLLLVFCRQKLVFIRHWPANLVYGLSLLPLCILILSQSRGPFLAGVAVIVCLFGLNLLKSGKVCFKRISVLLLTLIVGAACFLSYARVDIDRGSTGRTEIWEQAIDVIKEKPVLGHGIATKFRYKFNYNGQTKLSGHPHNIYLSALVHTGIVGLVLQIAALGAGLYVSTRRYLEDQDATFLITIGFGAFLGFVDFGGYYTNLGSTWIVFWFPLAALLFRPAQAVEQVKP